MLRKVSTYVATPNGTTRWEQPVQPLDSTLEKFRETHRASTKFSLFFPT